MDPIKAVFESFLAVKRDPDGVYLNSQMCVEA
jgi:hypothetical protein